MRMLPNIGVHTSGPSFLGGGGEMGGGVEIPKKRPELKLRGVQMAAACYDRLGRSLEADVALEHGRAAIS